MLPPSGDGDDDVTDVHRVHGVPRPPIGWAPAPSSLLMDAAVDRDHPTRLPNGHREIGATVVTRNREEFAHIATVVPGLAVTAP
jgi:hypothetical protein